MSLYFAPAFFFYLLSLSIWDAIRATASPAGRVFHATFAISKLGAVVMFTFLVHWLPFCSRVDSAYECAGRMADVCGGDFLLLVEAYSKTRLPMYGARSHQLLNLGLSIRV